jgi:CheY-like chemotaxis protein
MTAYVSRSPRDRAVVVLLAQPERDDRDMYAEYLSHMGLTPICVQDADSALRPACRADIIVTELLLPGVHDGYELIHRLKRNASTCHIPIVVLTGCARTTEEARARSAGCDVFLSKPCLPDALLLELRRMLAVHATSGKQARHLAEVWEKHMSAESTQTLSERAEVATAEHRLKELGITLPAPPEPFGSTWDLSTE